MNKKLLSLVVDVLFASLLLAGCGKAATPAPTATLRVAVPTASPTSTPDLVATGKASRQSTMQAQQTKNIAYHATSISRQTESSRERSTALAPIPTPWPTSTPVPTSPSTCRSDWINFVNGYYGYAICVPPSAKIHKNEGIEGVSPEDIPPGLNRNDDIFDYLNMTYPPGLRVEIAYRSGFIKIVVPDNLGGTYVDNFIGGLGEEDGFVWVWTEEEVIIGDQPYTATVLRQCESHAPEAKCGEGEVYSVRLSDGSTIRFGGGWVWNQGSYSHYPSDKAELLEMLRTFRPAPKTELYCPNPAPIRLAGGGYAYANKYPPLFNHDNVRSAPGINQGYIGSIEPGNVVEFLEGPVCNNSLQWWKVRVLATGLVGWTPEGDHHWNWLIPCVTKENCGPP